MLITQINAIIDQITKKDCISYVTLGKLLRAIGIYKFLYNEQQDPLKIEEIRLKKEKKFQEKIWDMLIKNNNEEISRNLITELLVILFDSSSCPVNELAGKIKSKSFQPNINRLDR